MTYATPTVGRGFFRHACGRPGETPQRAHVRTKIIILSLRDSILIIVNSIKQPVSHSLASSKIWVKQDGGQPMLQHPSPFLQERRPIFRQRGFRWEGRDNAVLLAREGTMQSDEQLLECIVAFMDVYHRSLLCPDDTFVHNVSTTKLISHARPSPDFHLSSKQARGTRVVTQPYVV